MGLQQTCVNLCSVRVLTVTMVGRPGWSTPMSNNGSDRGKPLLRRSSFNIPAHDMALKQWHTKEIARQELRRHRVAVGDKVRRGLMAPLFHHLKLWQVFSLTFILGLLLVRSFLSGYQNISIGSLLISKFRFPYHISVISKGW